MNAKKPLVIDDARAPEMFATHASAFSLPTGMMVSINLASQRMVDGEFVDVVVGRLVMPINGFQDMAAGVERLLASLSPANIENGAGSE